MSAAHFSAAAQQQRQRPAKAAIRRHLSDVKMNFTALR